jgi:hypothetical protein
VSLPVTRSLLSSGAGSRAGDPHALSGVVVANRQNVDRRTPADAAIPSLRHTMRKLGARHQDGAGLVRAGVTRAPEDARTSRKQPPRARAIGRSARPSHG